MATIASHAEIITTTDDDDDDAIMVMGRVKSPSIGMLVEVAKEKGVYIIGGG